MIKISYSGYRFPPEIIQHAIWLYIRFTHIPGVGRFSVAADPHGVVTPNDKLFLFRR